VPPWAKKYVAEASKPAKATGPKPGEANYISPKMRAETAARIKSDAERRKAEGVHDPPPVASRAPGFRLPPLPGEASPDPHAVVQRLLVTEQAKSMHYGRFGAWTTTAMKYGVPTPELITAALATGTTAELWAIDSLAKKLQSGVGRGGDLQGISGMPTQTHPAVLYGISTPQRTHRTTSRRTARAY
jgi:hypothetical protein